MCQKRSETLSAVISCEGYWITANPSWIFACVRMSPTASLGIIQRAAWCDAHAADVDVGRDHRDLCSNTYTNEYVLFVLTARARVRVRHIAIKAHRVILAARIVVFRFFLLNANINDAVTNVKIVKTASTLTVCYASRRELR
jgi:hypothetical protein